MEEKKNRKYSNKEKVEILKKYLVNKESASSICEKYGIHPNRIYEWQKQFFENGEKAFEKESVSVEMKYQSDKKRMEEKLQKKDEVLSELMEEHLTLKKKLGMV